MNRIPERSDGLAPRLVHGQADIREDVIIAISNLTSDNVEALRGKVLPIEDAEDNRRRARRDCPRMPVDEHNVGIGRF